MATRFFCENPDCERFQKLTIVGKVIFHYRDGEFRPENQKCSTCGDIMAIHETEEEGPITCNYAGFNSMTPEQKRDALKKRTEVLDRQNDAAGVKEHYKNKAINKFFGK